MYLEKTHYRIAILVLNVLLYIFKRKRDVRNINCQYKLSLAADSLKDIFGSKVMVLEYYSLNSARRPICDEAMQLVSLLTLLRGLTTELLSSS